MLADDGRLVFLDFGLMSRVDDKIMEAFAMGIQCVLSKDYVGLVRAFVDTGFIGTPIEWRAKEADPWQSTHPNGDDLTQIMAKELKERMEACPGGGSRFGALSVVLSDMGFFWQMYTPPYISECRCHCMPTPRPKGATPLASRFELLAPHVVTPPAPMRWLRLLGFLKLQVFFAKEPYKRDYILQKRPRI